MKIITINLPNRYIDAIQVLNDLGEYSSRSEAVRKAIKDLINEELSFFQEIDQKEFRRIIKSKKEE